MYTFRKYLMGLDSYERHTIVSRILSERQSKTVLDVGGHAGYLQKFLKSFRVIALNVDDSGDIRYGGHLLPFADNAFDAVVSLDVLEHIPSPQRHPLIQEMIRVANKDVIFCTPLGTEYHCNIEKELNDAWFMEFEEDHPMLREHIANGLPTLHEMEALLNGKNYDLLFVGNTRLSSNLFLSQLKIQKYKNVLYKALLKVYTVYFSFPGYRLKINKEPDEFTNRVYAHIKCIH